MNERSGLVLLLTFGLGPPVSFDLNAFLHLPTLLSSSVILVVVCQWLSRRWTGRLPHWDQLVKERDYVKVMLLGEKQWETFCFFVLCCRLSVQSSSTQVPSFVRSVLDSVADVLSVRPVSSPTCL